MSTTREQLIADWRRRLAAAERAPVASSQRQAWLAVMRMRLYRFLLSLYGAGQWRGELPAAEEPASGRTGDVVFDSPAAWPLAGKPAKSDGKIREVLKAVASAQVERPAHGPWIDGLPQKEWTVVVGPASGLDVDRCTLLFDGRGIVNRRFRLGSIVVPAVMADQARGEICAHAAWLRKPPPPKPPRPLSAAAFWLAVGITFAPLALAGAVLIALSRYPHALEGNELGDALLYTLALFAALMSIAFIRPIARLVQIVDRFIAASHAALRKRLCSKR